MDVCPYCKMVINEIADFLNNRCQNKISTDKYEGTIMTMLSRDDTVSVDSRFAFRR